MKLKVTIGVCVRNCEDSVKEAINSVLDQDFPHELMEVIFVDDGSKDKTLFVINSYVPKIDMHVKVFHHEWKGLGLSRNVVVNNASGDYIVWVDGDMTFPKDHVRKQVEFMEQNPKVGVAKARYGILSGTSLVASLEDATYSAVYSKYGGKPTSKALGTGGSIYRVEAIRQVGGFDEHITGVGEDMDAEYRIRNAGWLTYMGTTALFYERRRRTWKDLWNESFWYGYGAHNLLRKNRSIFALYKMIPPAGLLAGVWYSTIAYKITRRKSAFLLPVHSVFKTIAWCFGFAKGKLDSLARWQFLRDTNMAKVVVKKPAPDLIERKLLLVDPWYQLILKIINPVLQELKGKRILEVGCGLGGFCINIASRSGKVIGLDVSSSAIHSAKKLAQQSRFSSQLDFVIGDAQFLPFQDQTNDLVICSETLEHVTNYEKAFSEIIRVINKSGHLCITVPNLLSTLFFEYVVLLLIGQPQYAKKFAYVEKEHIFHLFKLKRLLNREDIRVMEIRSTDFLHLPPTVRRALKIGQSLKLISDRMEDYLEAHGLPLRLFGANIGVLARKE